jgi:hypothetical protein
MALGRFAPERKMEEKKDDKEVDLDAQSNSSK